MDRKASIAKSHKKEKNHELSLQKGAETNGWYAIKENRQNSCCTKRNILYRSRRKHKLSLTNMRRVTG